MVPNGPPGQDNKKEGEYEVEEEEEAPVSSKHKIPSPSQENQEDDEEYEEESVGSGRKGMDYMCESSGESFRSGRALGGHVRIHSRSSQPSSSRTAAAHFTAAKASNSNSNVACVECGRNFPTLKSLSGHMNSHPDRPWRGNFPPTALSVSPPASDDVVQIANPAPAAINAVDLMTSLAGLGWPVAFKKVRSAGKTAADSDREQTKKEADAVSELLSQSGAAIKKNPPHDNLNRLNSKSGGRGDDDMKKKTRRKERMEEEDDGALPPKSYVCKICQISFTCFRRLGGHKRSHNLRNKINNDGPVQPEEINVQQGPAILDFDLNELPSKDQKTEEGHGNDK